MRLIAPVGASPSLTPARHAAAAIRHHDPSRAGDARQSRP